MIVHAQKPHRLNLFAWDNSEQAIKLRLGLVILGFVLGFVTISGRLIYLASGDYVSQKHYAKRTSKFRKDIVDREGNLLAVNLPAASLFANPERVIDAEGAVEKLLKIFPDLDKKNILQGLKSDKTFVWVKRDISPKEQQDIYNLGMPGFHFEREHKRIYTYGNLFSHVIGYVGRDMEGLAGLEKYFDEFLIDEKNISKVSDNTSALQLSLDLRVQSILNEEVENAVRKFNANGAAAIVVDPNNGEIIAMVSKPDFDPHRPGSASTNQLFNMATQATLEVGSGMKGLTISIGLDSGATALSDAYDLTYMKVGGFKVNDDHPEKGWHSVAEIFLHSSNIGVSQIMLGVGKETLRKYLKKLGLLDRLQLELPERGGPLFPPFNRWTDLSLVTMSYGYGISETPAHFIQAMIPIVNGGIKYPLTLIKRGNTEPLLGERVFSEKTSKDMRKLMRLVVAQGTGRKAEVAGYYIGGKTGTAFKAVNGKYDKSKRFSSFLGVMPASSPKYMIYMIIDDPKGIKQTYGFASGGWTAAPAVGAVFKRMASIYSMKKVRSDDPGLLETLNIAYKVRDET